MNILIDLHHDELHESLLKLFEDRFGFNVYTPIGTDWYSNGYWNISDNPDTIDQYLKINKFDAELWDLIDTDIYVKKINCSRYRESFKYITLDGAKNKNWDIIVTSHPNQFPSFEKFAHDNCPSAKLVMQFGNMMPAIPYNCKNVLNSTSSDFYLDMSGINFVNYSQEFCTIDLDTYTVPSHIEVINSFILYNKQHRSELLSIIGKELNWKVHEYGSGNSHGNIHNYTTLVNKIKDSGFIWHYKSSGDGFGHTLYKSFFAGRPVILNMRMFQFHRLNHLKFMEDNITCINCNIDSSDQDLTHVKIAEKILKYVDHYDTNSKIIFERIRNIVNFDDEFVKIKRFIENLK